MIPTKHLLFLTFFFTSISFSQYNPKLLWIEKKQKSNEFISALNELENIPKAQFTKQDWAFFHFIKASSLYNLEKKNEAMQEYLIAKKSYLALDSVAKTMDINIKIVFLIKSLKNSKLNSKSFLNESLAYYSRNDIDNKIKIVGLINIATSMINEAEAKQSYLLFIKALQLCKKGKNDIHISYAYNNLAYLYNEILLKPDSALIYLKKDLIYLKEKNNPDEICVNLINQASSYSKKREYKTAIALLVEANTLNLSKEKIETKYLINNYLSHNYKANNDFSNAVKALETSNIYRDQLEVSKQNIAVADIQTKYESEKKELENRNLSLENKRKMLWIYLFLGLIASGGIIGYLKIKNAKRKEKIAFQAHEIQKQKLEKVLKNQELESIEAMLQGQEKERAKLAAELHDDLGSMLATLKLNFQNIQQHNKKNSQDNLLFLKTDNLLEEAYQKVRTIAHNKNAGVIGSDGLLLAVKNMVKKAAIPNKLEINVTTFGLDERLENTLEVSIFRMIQELLTNIIKHSFATKASVEMTQHIDSLTIIIEDNGKGFDYNKIDKKAGMGLDSIDKKTDQLGGTFSIDSRLGKGTTIIIDIPTI